MYAPSFSPIRSVRSNLLAISKTLSWFAITGLLTLILPIGVAEGSDWPIVESVERQPLQASIDRLAEALRGMGEPFSKEVETEIAKLMQSTEEKEIVSRVQKILDPLCIAAVQVNPESRVHVIAGPASPKLIEKGWRTFLVKIHNEGGVTAPLRCSSPQALPMVVGSSSKPRPPLKVSPAESERRWLDLTLAVQEPLRPTLSGLKLEYRIVQLYSRDSGKREATLQFDVGQGTQDLGFRNELPILFDCLPSQEIPIAVRDVDGSPTTCSLLIKDGQNRVYPPSCPSACSRLFLSSPDLSSGW